MKSAKSVISYFHPRVRVGFFDFMRNINGLEEYGADKKTLTSLTPLIGGIFA